MFKINYTFSQTTENAQALKTLTTMAKCAMKKSNGGWESGESLEWVRFLAPSLGLHGRTEYVVMRGSIYLKSVL